MLLGLQIDWFNILTLGIVTAMAIITALAINETLYWNNIEYETALKHCINQDFFSLNRSFCMNQGIIP